MRCGHCAGFWSCVNCLETSDGNGNRIDTPIRPAYKLTYSCSQSLPAHFSALISAVSLFLFSLPLFHSRQLLRWTDSQSLTTPRCSFNNNNSNNSISNNSNNSSSSIFSSNSSSTNTSNIFSRINSMVITQMLCDHLTQTLHLDPIQNLILRPVLSLLVPQMNMKREIQGLIMTYNLMPVLKTLIIIRFLITLNSLFLPQALLYQASKTWSVNSPQMITGAALLLLQITRRMGPLDGPTIRL